MKFVTLIAVVISAQNAFAQTSESAEMASLGETGDEVRTSCLAADNPNQCCTDYGTCVQSLGDNSEQCAAVARLCGNADVDAALRDGCRRRNAIVQNNDCACDAGLQWDSDKTCCTANPATYERRQNACERSGGTYHCSSRGGWCGCPLGMSHPIDEDGHVDYSTCGGEAVNRERIQEMRDNIATLTAEAEEAARQIAALQAERDALRTALDQALGQLDELGNLADTVDDLEQQLAEMDAELSFLRHLHEEFIARQAQTIADLGGIPPLPPGIPDEDEPLPGTHEAIAAAASSSSNPLAPTPPTEEEDETWCEANPGWCGFLIGGVIVAATGATLGICAAAGCFDSHDATVSWGRN